jgi:membrane protein
LGRLLPFSPAILEFINFVISFIIITLLFAFILKVLPDVQIKWKNTFVGAIITSLLFTIGKAVIGIYIGHSGVSSEYGAAASLIVLLLWVYYSSQILFFGAEFTKAYTLTRGDEIIPSQYSVLTTKASQEKNSRNTSRGSKAAAAIGRGFTQGFIDEATRKRARNKKKRR